MKNEQQQNLIKKFPLLFSRYNTDFGFEVGDGWYKLIYHLSQDLKSVAPLTVLSKMKEKFGGLNLVTDYCTEEGISLIQDAERESLLTCESCGKAGRPNLSGWIRTLCPPCTNRRNNVRSPGSHLHANRKKMRNPTIRKK